MVIVGGHNMIIRKLYRIESAHTVRNCSTSRCKYSLHGHSGIIEVFLTADGLDSGMMVCDFGLMKSHIKDLIDSFDHAYVMWNKESEDFKRFIKDNSKRWVELPVSPSAEAFSIVLFRIIDAAIRSTKFNNNENHIKLYSIRYHETETGYAEAFASDINMITFNLDEIKFSDQVKSEWIIQNLWDKILTSKRAGYINPVVVNPTVEIQIKE